MEVQAHSHLTSGETHTPDPDLHRGRKKWSHYFWEFFMMFLAVSIISYDQYLKNNRRIVELFNHVGTLVDFKPAFPVNFEQIKNSGSLRYFKNKKLVSSLSDFDRLLETTTEVYVGYNGFIQENLQPFMINHLNALQFDIFSRTVLVPNPDIYDWNRREAMLLVNKVNLKKSYDIFFINQFLKQCAEKNIALISAIKKEYHL